MQLLNYLQYMALLLLVSLLNKEFSYALRDVRVKVPHAVRRGEKATLKCFYDIEGDSLYSVKWYKGRREFYRYTPNENPAMKIFRFPDVKVERHASNESQLVLDSVTLATSGKYSCEVSADAPSFHTLIAAGEMEIVETPHNAPFITGIRPRYRIGDILRGNCTSRHSKPAANLTWTVNNEEVDELNLRPYRIFRDTRNDLETSVLGIQFVVDNEHFENGKLKLRCIAEIHNIYWKENEKLVTEAGHHHKYTNGINSVGNHINIVSAPEEPYDQFALHDGEMLQDKSNGLMTIFEDFLLNFMPNGQKQSHEDTDELWHSISSSSIPQTAFLTRWVTVFWLGCVILPWLTEFLRVLSQSKLTSCKTKCITDNALGTKQRDCDKAKESQQTWRYFNTQPLAPFVT